MDYVTHEIPRWRIVYGQYQGVEKTAVNELYRLVQRWTPYVVTVEAAERFSPEAWEGHVLYIGTLEDNCHLAGLADQGLFRPESRREGYALKVMDAPRGGGKKLAVLQGADGPGVLWAVRDFLHLYLQERRYDGYLYYNRFTPFVESMPDFERRSAPKVENRGLWSWGHVIYDYKGYIDNMSRWKLNCLIVWNDFAPLNAGEVVEYAHSRGVKVVWGFSWCWGEPVDPNSPEELEKWTRRAYETYRDQYSHLGGDGIYFQTFTETADTRIGGRSIAQLACLWVNTISRRLLEAYPDLWIQFGVHASSIKGEWASFREIDPRISIVWEDVGDRPGGCFPYAYDPRNQENFAAAKDYTAGLLALRGEKEDYGAVLKGFTVLNWERFEHQKGPFVMGEADPVFIRQRTEEKAYLWKFALPYWQENAGRLQEYLRLVADAPIARRTVTALVEDGLWEAASWYPAVLLAELLWDWDRDLKELITALTHCEDVRMA